MLLMEGEWNKPFGIENFKISRLGLALGINVAGLPSFGFTGDLTVVPPGRTSLTANITLCIDTADLSRIVIDVHFTRLLLADIVNTFANKALNWPNKIAEMGFPDEVNIYVSPNGNDACFGKVYKPGVEIHGTFQIPFLHVRARADISIVFDKFHLKADLEMDPINYGSGLLKIVSAQSDSAGPYLKMNIGDTDDFMINGSCRVCVHAVTHFFKVSPKVKESNALSDSDLWISYS